MILAIQPFEAQHLELMINYFLEADEAFLRGMGADPAKLPAAEDWHKMLLVDLARPLPDKQFYYLLWTFNGEPVGHSNINKIVFGQEAYMHLHMWQSDLRQRGQGREFVKQSVVHYFNTFQLQSLYCEPYAHNPAPNKTLPKAGFRLLKTYITTPGWINFEQEVNRWVLARED